MRQGSGWPEGYALRRYDSLDFTNEEARRRARMGERGPLWIVAREQIAGRGRRGRAWISQGGNLFATLLIEAGLPAAANLGFAAGLAAAETIDSYVPAETVTLKWPNDVLLKGRKTAGILLETAGEGLVAIGMGINLAHHPLDTEFPATSLSEASNISPNPEDVLPRLASRMAAWYEVWRHQGFAPVRAAWLLRAGGLGADIRVRLAERTVEGVFESIDENGVLLLREPSGALARISAGDVFFVG